MKLEVEPALSSMGSVYITNENTNIVYVKEKKIETELTKE